MIMNMMTGTDTMTDIVVYSVIPSFLSLSLSLYNLPKKIVVVALN